MSPGALRGLAAGLVFLSLATSTPSMAKAPPSPPGPPRPASRKAVIRPVPEAPGHYLLHQNRADTLFTGTGLALRLAPPERPVRELHWGVAGVRSVTPQPLAPRETRFNQLVGPPERWKRNLPTWGALYYPAVAPGVDLWFEAQEGGVTYSLRAERGADLRQVRLEWRGAQALRLAEGGRALEVVLADGVLREEGLRCGQEAADGSSREVPCRYREVRPLGAALWEYVVEVDVEEPGRPVWVDPTIKWNTFLGGTGSDELRGLTIINDGRGFGFVVGTTNTPTVTPSNQGDPVEGSRGSSNVVVSKFNNNETLEWTTVFGGNDIDTGNALAIGSGGFIYVAGSTASTDFQFAGGSTLTGGARKDGFVARLESISGALKWFQHVGDLGDEEIHSLAFKNGKLFAAGWTTSSQMPGAPAGTFTLKGKRELFVSRLAETGSVEKTLIRSGSGDEEALGIVTEETTTASAAPLYVTGYTTSTDFPTAPRQPSAPPGAGGSKDAVVFKLDQELTLQWGNFIGGNALDVGYGLVHVPATVNPSLPARLMVVGTTESSNFPTNGEPPAKTDAFLASFDTDLGDRAFSTVVGGAESEEGYAIATGSAGSVYIGGRTTSASLPVTGDFDNASSAAEGFVIRLGRDGEAFAPEWGTFIGGALDDEVRGLGSAAYTDGKYDLFIGGTTSSGEMLRSPKGANTFYSGGGDMFFMSIVAKDLTPPKLMVVDGFTQDEDQSPYTDRLLARWNFEERESDISDFSVGVGTVPGCDDFLPFQSVGKDTSVTLNAAKGLPLLTPGTWYFVSVRATNTEGLSSTTSSDGIFIVRPEGGPEPTPLPAAGECPGEEPGTDGGTDGGPQTDGGGSGADGGDLGPESPLGWSCGTPGGPTGFAVLVVVAFGLLAARRKTRS